MGSVTALAENAVMVDVMVDAELTWPSRDLVIVYNFFVSACSDQETDESPLRGLSNIRKLTYSIDPSVPWSEPL